MAGSLGFGPQPLSGGSAGLGLAGAPLGLGAELRRGEGGLSLSIPVVGRIVAVLAC